jgi:hypothetical protein
MRFRTVTCITAMALLVALAVPVGLFAQEGIVSINAPGAGTGSGQGTTPVDINLAGTITGYYFDAGYVSHDFLLTPDGHFTVFDPPGADITDAGYGSEALRINQQGAIIGFYVDEYTVYHGFLRDPRGHFTIFDAPGADLTHGDGNGTFPVSINQEGAIVGYYIDINGAIHGFLRGPGGTFTTFNAPGAGTSSGQGTVFQDINLTGAITGYDVDAGYVYHDFLLTPDGHFTVFDPPGADIIDAGYGSEALSINRKGAITGFYRDEYTVFHGFLRDPAGHFTTFNAPGADLTHGDDSGTFPVSINQEGAISGYYGDANGVNHGFLREPFCHLTTVDAPGAGTMAGQGTIALTNNDVGAIVGYYIDINGAVHGFLRKP